MDNVVISNTGGIYLNNSASLEISNAEFTNNRYGVELNNNSSVVIGNANFASTTREALSAYNGSSISVSSSTISNTIDGDAIGIYDSNLTHFFNDDKHFLGGLECMIPRFNTANFYFLMETALALTIQLFPSPAQQ